MFHAEDIPSSKTATDIFGSSKCSWLESTRSGEGRGRRDRREEEAEKVLLGDVKVGGLKLLGGLKQVVSKKIVSDVVFKVI